MTRREQRRINRAKVLEALHSETGSFGGGNADERVPVYIADPIGASTVLYGYIGGLALRRFYIAPGKPNNSERASLWEALSVRFSGLKADAGGWDGSTRVLSLQAIVESKWP